HSTLPDRASVVVIGGGVIGTSIAFHLAEAGVADVVLLERDQLASGSTSRAAGGVRAQFSDPVNIAIALRSLTAFAAFEERPGWAIDLHRVGYLFLLDRPEDVERFAANVAQQNELGVPSRIIDPDEASRLSPLAGVEGVLAASFCPLAGHASPEAVVQGYAAAARGLGVRILTGRSATAIEVDGGEIRAVATTHGRVTTTTVVCAAGIWSPAIGEMAGVALPVEPYLREVGFTAPIDGLPQPIPMTIDFTSGFYFHREGPGLLFGMADPDQEPGLDAPTDPDWLLKVMAVAERRAPALLDMGIAGGWKGCYEVTPDHNALIGEARTVSRFLYATGFSGHGFLQGPAVGEIIRDLYLGEAPCVDVTGLSADRFAGRTARPELNII
ncbi:MAG TPA: FAD-binding oxidoreductase, partial [Gaiellales bacterium]